MGSLYLDFLPAAMEAAAKVAPYSWAVYDDDWLYRSRSSGGFDKWPLFVCWHHTAGADNAWGDANYMVNSADARPIANICIDSEIAIIMAGGATNTEGSGGPRSFSRGTVPLDDGNRHAIGIEICNNGVGAPYPEAQINFLFALSNELNKRCGNQPDDCCIHAEWAPTRKIDPARADTVQGAWRPASINSSGTWNGNDLRAECRHRAVTVPVPPVPPPIKIEGDDMPLYAAKVEGEGFWLLTGLSGRQVSGDDIDYVAKKMWTAKAAQPDLLPPLVDLNTGANVRERADVSAVSMTSIKAFGGDPDAG